MSHVKLSRGAMRSWTIGQIKKQGGICPLCKKEISLQVMGNKSDYVVDHCHESGLIRAVLHRSCNASEGRVANAAGRWGAKSMQYSEIIPYLRSLVEYLETTKLTLVTLCTQTTRHQKKRHNVIELNVTPQQLSAELNRR